MVCLSYFKKYRLLNLELTEVQTRQAFGRLFGGDKVIIEYFEIEYFESKFQLCF